MRKKDKAPPEPTLREKITANPQTSVDTLHTEILLSIYETQQQMLKEIQELTGNSFMRRR